MASTPSSRYQQFPSITHTTGSGDYESYQNLVTRVGQQQQSRTSSGYHAIGQTATKVDVGVTRRVSVPPEPPHRKPESHEKYQKLSEIKKESNARQSQVYENSRQLVYGNGSVKQNLQREIQSGVTLRPIDVGVQSIQQKPKPSRNLDKPPRDTNVLLRNPGEKP